MKKTIIVITAIFATFYTSAQDDMISGKVRSFFEAIHSADTVALNSMFYKDASLNTLLINEDLKIYKVTDKSTFLGGVSQMIDTNWEEHLHSIEIHQNDMMAIAWTPYSFYVGNRLTHCGVNVFNFIKLTNDQWLITSISDTRDNSESCRNDKAMINTMLNDWHQAATDANFEKYFNHFTVSAIYLGTDISERWTIKEFSAFAKPYFDRGSAWEFKKTRRNITMAPFTAGTAWFDEDLTTWMGPCRGSGVAVLTEDGWKIQHYVLSVAVSNDNIQDYLKILGEEK